MNTRSLSALLTGVFAFVLLASGCATPTSSTPPNNCAAGQMSCSGTCKTVATDNQNCGTCGNACGSGRTCENSMCKCAAGLMDCGGQCVGNDAQHCGGCNPCPSG